MTTMHVCLLYPCPDCGAGLFTGSPKLTGGDPEPLPPRYHVRLEYWPLVDPSETYHYLSIDCGGHRVDNGVLILTGCMPSVHPTQNYPLFLVKEYHISEVT